MDISKYGIKTGKKFKVLIYDEEQETYGELLPGKFESQEDENTIVMTAPMKEGNIYPVHINSMMDIYFIDNNNPFKKNYYRFTAKVISREIRDNMEYLKIMIEGDIEKIQRRRYFRLEFVIPVRYRVLDLESKQSNALFKKGFTRDISGGGLCINIKEKLKKNDLIECELGIMEDETINCKGIIVRTDKKIIENRIIYRTAISINDIDEKKREKLVKYIFDKQRKLRKKGMI
jgi:c-di-GMP-binding flagellar brake protein YcgR